VQAYRGRDLAAMVTKRRLALTALLGVCLALGGCSSFAGVVSDTWPTWAGGMPKDVPPRPGAPGYEEFIAHQQRQDPAAAGSPADAGAAAQAAAPAPGAPATTGTTSRGATAAPTANPAVTRTAPQQFPPAYARPDDRATTRGGLY
jgi:hypothetical protein